MDSVALEWSERNAQRQRTQDSEMRSVKTHRMRFFANRTAKNWKTSRDVRMGQSSKRTGRQASSGKQPHEAGFTSILKQPVNKLVLNVLLNKILYSKDKEFLNNTHPKNSMYDTIFSPVKVGCLIAIGC